jgi:hypothetical protein
MHHGALYVNQAQKPPLIMLDANHSSNFETLKLNSVLAMSTNISLEELLGIKNNYKIYFCCTGINCFH